MIFNVYLESLRVSTQYIMMINWRLHLQQCEQQQADVLDRFRTIEISGQPFSDANDPGPPDDKPDVEVQRNPWSSCSSPIVCFSEQRNKYTFRAYY